jgi:hypothetical protein
MLSDRIEIHIYQLFPFAIQQIIEQGMEFKCNYPLLKMASSF